MMPPVRLRLFAATAAVSALIFAVALASAQLTPLPGTPLAQPVSTIPPPGVDMPAPDASAAFEAARKGVVVLEQAGRVIGVGTVLGADARILTALSAMAGAEACDVKYPDGHKVRARVGHKDADADLALLIPLSGRYAEGLAASDADPAGADLRTFAPGPQNRTLSQPAKVKAAAEGHARDRSATSALLELDAKSLPLAGAPLIDATGGVSGVVVRMCRLADASVCAPMVAAQPLSALRRFLARTPVDAVPPSPWLGIQGTPEAAGAVRGVRVLAVAPGSPAHTGGLKSGDVITAVDAAPVDSPEQLQALIANHAVGESVKLAVVSGEKSRDAVVSLRAAP
jgi:S1-C subfamily serine protease